MIKLNGAEMQFNTFHDGSTHFFCIPPLLSGSVVEWFYEGDREFANFFYLLLHLKAHQCHIELRLYYLPHSRQDRIHSEEDVFTLKYLCNWINSLQVDEVVIFDSHSPVCEALLNNLTILSPKYIIEDQLNHYLPPDIILAYPDASAAKKYNSMGLNKPYVFGVKERDFKTGAIQHYRLCGEDNIAGKDILIIDDIISSGSTIQRLIDILKTRLVKDIYIYASHIENFIFSSGIVEEKVIKIYTTNSIYTGKHPKIEVIKNF